MHRKVLFYLRSRGLFVKCCKHTKHQIENMMRDKVVNEQKNQFENRYFLNG
ncbi:hypothetical protein J2R98_001515 [Alkalibacillus filiformis]|uniref:Fur-regulated basic protein A n=1 Tax=Alkalibacillus filiformis TaxID=200990 RepID=A0ABU0DTB6_9BACI|nr:hypothetical protein [Alkalibacillus filiformis]